MSGRISSRVLVTRGIGSEEMNELDRSLHASNVLSKVLKRRTMEGQPFVRHRGLTLYVVKPYVVVLSSYVNRQSGECPCIGVAKCNPSDTWNEEIGIAIAASRLADSLIEAEARGWCPPSECSVSHATYAYTGYIDKDRDQGPKVIDELMW